MKIDRIIKSGVLVVLQFLDVHSTLSRLAAGDGYEGNPLMAFLMQCPWLALLVKLVGIGLTIASYFWLHRKGCHKYAEVVIWFALIFYAFVVLSNYVGIL